MENEVIITGDYNADLLKINEKYQIGEYFYMVTSHSLYPKITLPTRYSNKHGTLIDNLNQLLTLIRYSTKIKQFSDHQPYFTVLNDFTLKELPFTYIKITKNDNISIQKVK